tara:strand:+ start:396 stop:689 length:294 start_codon:yes stop_codon:yes gene_type:complete
MNTKEKLLEIEELIGFKNDPVEVSLDEAVNIVHEHMKIRYFYCSIEGKLSSEARSTLLSYNIEIQTDTYSAGRNSTVSNTLRWKFKTQNNGNKENNA